MSSMDTLHVVAELAVAFAGFASLVTIIGRRAGRDDPRWDAARLRSMLETSLLVTAFALLPEIPFRAGAPPAMSWRICAALFAAAGLVLTLGQARFVRRLPGYSMQRPWTVFVGVLSGTASLGLALGAMGVLEAVDAAYLWGLYAYLAVSGLLFLRLVRSLLEHRDPDELQ